MIDTLQTALPKFDTTSLSADLSTKIKVPELPMEDDGSGNLVNQENGNLGSMLKEKSKLLGTNIEGSLDQLDKNIQAQAEQQFAELEDTAKQIEAAAEAAAKAIQDEIKRKKEEAKKAIEDAKKEAKEAYQKALTAKEQAEDMIAKLKGYKIPRLKKLKPVPTKDLPAPPQYAQYMDDDAKKEYAENAKSSATKGEPPAESLVAKPEIKIPNYFVVVDDMRYISGGGDYYAGKVYADGVLILDSNYTSVNYTKESVETELGTKVKNFGFFVNGKKYPPNPSYRV